MVKHGGPGNANGVFSPVKVVQDISTIAQNGHDLSKPGMALESPHSSLPYSYTGSSQSRPPIEISLVQTVEPAAAAYLPMHSWQPRGGYYNEVQGTVVTRVRAPEVLNSRNPVSGLRSPPFPQELSRFPAGTY